MATEQQSISKKQKSGNEKSLLKRSLSGPADPSSPLAGIGAVSDSETKKIAARLHVDMDADIAIFL